MSDMSQNEAAPPTADRRRAAVLRSLPLLLFTLCAFGIIVILAVSRVFQLSGNAELLDAAHVACSGNPVPGAAAYQRDSQRENPAPTLAFIEENGFLQAASNYTLEAWRPAEISEIELVLCTRPPRPAYRSLCDNESIINQFGEEMPVTLRAAQTGEVVAEGVIPGLSLADVECFDEMPTGIEIEPDDSIADERVHAWLTPYVNP